MGGIIIKEHLKGCLTIILILVGILVAGIILIFVWFNYSSPVNQAGREYGKDIKSYRNVEIESMENVLERMEVLDSHFHSTTFDKVQGGEKREVTLSDIKSLFGETNQVIEDVEMTSVNKVYKYHYEDVTLNFHEDFLNIDEFVMEKYTEKLYDSQSLDQLFIDTIVNHQSEYNLQDEKFEPILEEDISALMMDKPYTRKIRQSGWHTWHLNKQYYFDDGSGDYAPTEYLLMHLTEESDVGTELYFMERRYNEAYLKIDTREEMEKKNQALSRYMDFFEEGEASNSAEKLVVEDFSREFGDMARIMYDFRYGILAVTWLIQGGENTKEVIIIVPLTDVNKISNINDLADLEVLEFDSQKIYHSDKTLEKKEFIRSE